MTTDHSQQMGVHFELVAIVVCFSRTLPLVLLTREHSMPVKLVVQDRRVWFRVVNSRVAGGLIYRRTLVLVLYRKGPSICKKWILRFLIPFHKNFKEQVCRNLRAPAPCKSTRGCSGRAWHPNLRSLLNQHMLCAPPKPRDSEPVGVGPWVVLKLTGGDGQAPGSVDSQKLMKRNPTFQHFMSQFCLSQARNGCSTADYPIPEHSVSQQETCRKTNGKF